MQFHGVAQGPGILGEGEVVLRLPGHVFPGLATLLCEP